MRPTLPRSRSPAVTDDRRWSPHQPAAAPPVYPESRIWRCEKDRRWAEARIRDLPDGHELRFVIGGEGREELLMESVVYRAGESDDLATLSRGTQQNFLGHGWVLVGGAKPSQA